MHVRHSRLVSLALAVTFAAALVAAAVRPAIAETFPQKRAGWFLGIGIGGGTAGASANGTSSDRETAGAGSFRVGYDLNSDFGLGLESNAWTKSENSTTTTFSVAAATLYYHPEAAGGLVLRGGVGAGSADFRLKSGNNTTSISQSGFGLTVGGQYDFRVRRTFSLGPQVDFGWMSLDNDVKVNYVNFGLALDWHFIGQ